MAVPSKQVIIDSLVLVFSKSKIKNIVGTDALRTVLDIQYKDLIVGETFQMQAVWDLLAEQPGFDAEFAKPPVARFKQNEVLLGIHVKLPESMKDLGALELAGTAAHCNVPAAELEKIVARHDPRKQAERTAKRAEAAAAVMDADETHVGSRVRAPLIIGAIVVALAGFGFVGWQVYTSLSPSPNFAALTADSFRNIPVKSAKRLGRQAIIELSDDGWLAKKDEASLKNALKGLESGGIEVIVVRSTKGKIAASVQFHDSSKGRRVRVKFR